MSQSLINLINQEPIQIAIDGYSSCGKSTLAKALATYLHIHYIDSGAMYRAVCWYCLQEKIDILNEIEVNSILSKINIDLHDENPASIILNSHILKEELRTLEVSAMVSEISAHSSVRKKLVDLQRKLSMQKSVVMDGRDIGTVVFPQAKVKLFLTASTEIRAQRRYLEMLSKGQSISKEEVLNNLSHRDYIDSNRADSPLRQADDAILLDNSNLTQEEQFVLALQLIEKKLLS
ncbi:MAG TPA: (d)CMP kinase [Saprospiraceae bacterium]|nr:(d)CMP kinase [Saprospiraceae bacterium]